MKIGKICLLKMKKVATMHGEILKKAFKPIPIKTSYDLLDNLKEKNMTLKEWLDGLKCVECPQSLDKTCKNFECAYNYRLLHKMVYEDE